MSTTILIIGLMLFFSYFLSLQFSKTNIPDVLVLMLVGIMIGRLFGIVTPDDSGKIGHHRHHRAGRDPVRGRHDAESGRAGKSRGTTGLLALVSFALTAATSRQPASTCSRWNRCPPSRLGSRWGILLHRWWPDGELVKMSNKPGTVLVLESALTDVLSIVGVFALLHIHTKGGFEPGGPVGMCRPR